MPTLADDLAAVRRDIHRLRVDQARPTYPGWALEHRRGTEAALTRALAREAELVERLAIEEQRTLMLVAAATASGWPLLYAIAHVTASTRHAPAAQETLMPQPTDPSPEWIRQLLAERALNRRVRESIERGARRSAMRTIRQTPDEGPETDTTRPA